jgi:uncharacterized protein (DUF1015 family)
MATVRPFRALRPRTEVASAIAAVPYDVVSTDEARALAADHPLSFLHVSRAEIDLPPGTSPYDDAVYARAVKNFRALRNEMIEEESPSLYCYRLRTGDHQQTGLVGAFSVDEYSRDIIKKHEKTRRDKEDDRTRHIIELEAQTGPVFLTYRHTDRLDRLIDKITADAPLYDFVAEDNVVHTVWRAGEATAREIVAAVGEVPALYIADGHHRAASAARASAQAAAAGRATDDQAYFLAVAFPDNQTRILPYHRVVKDLGGRSAEAFLADVRQRFEVTPGGPSPERKGDCAMRLGDAWYTVRLAKPAASTSADPTASLDVSLLQDGLLAPILGVLDPRTDKRIDFVGGIRGTGELERLVASGTAAVAFSMFPVTVAELMAIADGGAIMPPKSTWFEPKLRDALLIHLI